MKKGANNWTLSQISIKKKKIPKHIMQQTYRTPSIRYKHS